MTTEKNKMIVDLIESVREATSLLNIVSAGHREELEDDIIMSVRTINRKLFAYDSIQVGGADFPGEEYHCSISEDRISQWSHIVSNVLEELVHCRNDIDRRFIQLIHCAKHISFERMFAHCKELFHKKPADEQFKIARYYQNYSYFWGTLEPEHDRYDVMENRIRELKSHWKEFQWLYENMQDYRSKHVVLKTLEYWVTYDVDCILDMKENCFKDYFDPDILPACRSEVFVDLGGYNGDTIKDFVDFYEEYQRVYSFDVSTENVEMIRQNTKEYHDIVVIHKAAGDRNGTIYVEVDDDISSENTVLSTRMRGGKTREVEMVTIDDEIQDRITMIKMDIEGAEQGALLGCRRHITKEHPKLLICVYHNNEDIWKIASMIHEMDDSYRFYMRSNGKQWGPAEIVLFAI